MIRIFFICNIIVIFGLSSKAQNLIPNGGFEDTIQLNFGLTKAMYWTYPTNPEPNHYHRSSSGNWSIPLNLAGYQETRGNFNNAYYGILMYDLQNNGISRSREYLQCEMNNKLLQDSTYCFRIYISLADSSKYASRNQMGLYFSKSQINQNIIYELPFQPQLVISPNNYIIEKEKWLQYDLSYVASGGESHLIIGNFNDTSDIDSLGVIGGINEIYKINYYYIDDLWLSHCDSLPDTSIGIWEQQTQHKLKLYPNPSNASLNVESEVSVVQIKIYNVQGRLIQVLKQPAKQIELPETKGIYLLRLELENGELLSRKVVRN